jgi:hypothetical protein
VRASTVVAREFDADRDVMLATGDLVFKLAQVRVTQKTVQTSAAPVPVLTLDHLIMASADRPLELVADPERHPQRALRPIVRLQAAPDDVSFQHLLFMFALGVDN